ncbi:Uncharacterised protein [Sphingobacterium multivorum]|uniref:RagB/SusD family nutrient uptake outer membrane protein n=1 Tax=Sphingobacterium multivorum TaxID=28454 RepID=A0A2X2KU99_SPHMU|nr:hypothetical protein [Sphingobacterium multivorum]SPZ85659.1 Uncharacterised protein [Sphingobacterium multivorum]
MNNTLKKSRSAGRGIAFLLAGTLAISSCSKEFLQPDPLSIYIPNETFNTESGLLSAMAICDRHLKGIGPQIITRC